MSHCLLCRHRNRLAVLLAELAAAYEMTGYIRNAALRAAFFATSAGSDIKISRLRRVANLEMSSMGKAVSRAHSKERSEGDPFQCHQLSLRRRSSRAPFVERLAVIADHEAPAGGPERRRRGVEAAARRAQCGRLRARRLGRAEVWLPCAGRSAIATPEGGAALITPSTVMISRGREISRDHDGERDEQRPPSPGGFQEDHQ